MRRNHAPAPLSADADKPKLMIEQPGIQVFDAREYVRVVLTADPPRGVKGGLRIEGFKQTGPNTWEAPNHPLSIFGAQAVVDVYYRSHEGEIK